MITFTKAKSIIISIAWTCSNVVSIILNVIYQISHKKSTTVNYINNEMSFKNKKPCKVTEIYPISYLTLLQFRLRSYT